MATGDTAEGKFPPTIVADDEVPRSGYYRVTLFIPNMKTKTKGVINRTTEIANGSIKFQITDSEVSVHVKIDEKDKSTIAYSYIKKLPEKINDTKSSYELKDGQVKIILCKTEKVSWGQHDKYFLKRND